MALIILSGYVSKQGLMNTFQQHQKNKCRWICKRTSFSWCFSL